MDDGVAVITVELVIVALAAGDAGAPPPEAVALLVRLGTFISAGWMTAVPVHINVWPVPRGAVVAAPQLNVPRRLSVIVN